MITEFLIGAVIGTAIQVAKFAVETVIVTVAVIYAARSLKISARK
jgi:hypothetical protein